MNCDGWRMSDCCNAFTDPDVLICSECGEHCGTMCDFCDERDCDSEIEVHEKDN